MAASADRSGDAMGVDFGKISNQYDIIAERPNQRVTQFLQECDFDHIVTALDYGCGTGTISKHLQDSGIQVDATDLSEAMLQVAKAKCPALRTMQCQANGQCDQYMDSYDLVVSSMVLHHAHDSQAILKLLSQKASKMYVLVEFKDEMQKYDQQLLASGWKLHKSDLFTWEMTEQETEIAKRAREHTHHECKHSHHGSEHQQHEGHRDHIHDQLHHMQMHCYTKA